MKANLQEIRKNTFSVDEYIDKMKDTYKERFLTKKQNYKMKQEVISRLRKMMNKYVIAAFSAEWCKDCVENIPVLALMNKEMNIEVMIYEGLMTDPLNPNRTWKIPLSPPPRSRDI